MTDNYVLDNGCQYQTFRMTLLHVTAVKCILPPLIFTHSEFITELLADVQQESYLQH